MSDDDSRRDSVDDALAAKRVSVCVPDLYWHCRARGAHMKGLARCHDWNQLGRAANESDSEQLRLATGESNHRSRSKPKERVNDEGSM